MAMELWRFINQTGTDLVVSAIVFLLQTELGGGGGLQKLKILLLMTTPVCQRNV